MSTQDIPQTFQIRFGNGNEHRYRSIQQAAELYDSNKSEAVSKGCSDVSRLFESIQAILRRDDLTTQQKQEIAELCSTPNLSFTVETEVTAETG